MAYKKNLREIIYDLIRDECRLNGFAFEDRIVKKASLLNIDYEKFRRIKDHLLDWERINVDGKKIFLP